MDTKFVGGDEDLGALYVVVACTTRDRTIGIVGSARCQQAKGPARDKSEGGVEKREGVRRRGRRGSGGRGPAAGGGASAIPVAIQKYV